MLRFDLTRLIQDAVDRLIASGKLPEAVRHVVIEVSDTKSPEHGDYACNFALVATKPAGLPPRQIGEMLAEELLRAPSPLWLVRGEGVGGEGLAPFEAIEIAGPGFLNLKLNPAFVASYVPQILEADSHLPQPRNTESSQRLINVEFVSVNPNGPITVGSGRGAAFGDTLCRVLEAAGDKPHREYYINDGVNSEQMRLFAESVRHYYEKADREVNDGDVEFLFPEKGYRGDYVEQVARDLYGAINPLKCWEDIREEPVLWWQQQSQQMMLGRQRQDLQSFAVQFNTWFSEQSLHDAGAVDRCLEQLKAKGAADEEPYRTLLKLAKGGVVEDVVKETQTASMEAEADDTGSAGVSPADTSKGNTLWLRSTKFGDDMDRVLRRRDGRLTYIASDVAYHKDKLTDESGTRGTGPVDKMITILGPDHHGYINRLQAVVAALLESPLQQDDSSDVDLTEIESKIYDSPEERTACRAALAEAQEKLEVVIFQIVRFVKDGKPAPMRKRDGNIYELRDLINELGANIAPEAAKEEQQRIGKDVARFFYLMRSHDTHMDFDIDLATKQSDENPVFYVQYAHARICSVLAKAEAEPSTLQHFNASRLQHPRELALIKKITDLPFEVQRSAKDYGVHRLTTYAIELARTYHHFYDACRVIQPDEPELTKARLALCQAARIALRETLNLLGVSSPERM